jgi:FecR protein/SPOR domain
MTLLPKALLTALSALVVASLTTTTSLAAPAKVEQVQFPAWLVRGNLSVPLTPGTQLQPKDTVRTGGNARVYLLLDEGSRVKLGENAKFEIDSAGKRKGVFTATLNVVEGAFRFTTSAVGKLNKRDVTIRVANVTAGIRGTDLWGKSTTDRDIVCLIEGDITVKSDTSGEVRMNQPLQFFQKPRGLAPLPVGKVEVEQLKKWGTETEIDSGAPAASATGAYRVEAGSFTERDAALTLARQLRAAGYPADTVDGKGVYVVAIAGLVGETQATALARNLATIPGTQPTVRR